MSVVSLQKPQAKLIQNSQEEAIECQSTVTTDITTNSTIVTITHKVLAQRDGNSNKQNCSQESIFFFFPFFFCFLLIETLLVPVPITISSSLFSALVPMPATTRLSRTVSPTATPVTVSPIVSTV